MKTKSVVIILIFVLLFVYSYKLRLHEELHLYGLFFEVAVYTKNPRPCSLIFSRQLYGDYYSSVEELRWRCRQYYIVETEDVDYCRSLDDEVKYNYNLSQRDFCLLKLAKKLHKPELCDEMRLLGSTEKDQSIQFCREEATK